MQRPACSRPPLLQCPLAPISRTQTRWMPGLLTSEHWQSTLSPTPGQPVPLYLLYLQITLRITAAILKNTSLLQRRASWYSSGFVVRHCSLKVLASCDSKCPIVAIARLYKDTPTTRTNPARQPPGACRRRPCGLSPTPRNATQHSAP